MNFCYMRLLRFSYFLLILKHTTNKHFKTNNFMKKILSIMMVLSCTLSFAQIDVESILEGGASDAQNLLKGYLTPAAEGLGYSLGSGWNTTAKPHKFLGFDISVIANAAIIPSNKETFTFNNSDFTSIKLDDESIVSAELPTLFGSSKLEDRPLLEFLNKDGNISSSSLPGVGLEEEIGYNVMPSAALQLGLGLFKNTELKLRYAPKVDEKEFEFSSFGIGVLHDVKQWIPGIKLLPFQLSAFVGYNDVKSKAFLDVDNNPDQSFEINTSSLTYQLLASKKLLFLTVYGGVGMTSFETDVNVLGTYKTTNEGSLIDPIKLDYSGKSFRGNLGLTFKILWVLKVSADYTFQEYDTFSLTAGFTIR